MDWFFQERYFPALSSCLAVDGRILSALQSYPLHARVRGHILPASMLAGDSTHPDHSGKGYMRQTMLHYMQQVRAAGIPIIVQTPAHLTTFFSRGFYPATDTLHVELAWTRGVDLPQGVCSHSLKEDLALLHRCYHLATAPYSGMISRSIADFAYKFRDYATDNAQCLVYTRDDTVKGYCVYYTLPDRVHAEEVVALDDDGYTALLHALCHEANGRNLHAKLPPDAQPNLPGASFSPQPQGVMGVVHVQELLSLLLHDDRFCFDIIDRSVPQNHGVWDGTGKSATHPQITLEAGRLGQLLCGYATLEELIVAGHATVADADAAHALNILLPKQPCFIVDEY